MPNFPVSFDDDESLYIAVNNKRTTLTSSINAVTLTIPVSSTAGFPDTGFITINSDASDITQAEAITYSSITSTTFNATARGAGGTTAAAHTSGDSVDLTVQAAHHNELKDAIINLEHFVGVSGSPSFGLVVRETDSNPTVSGVTTIVVTTGTLTNNGGGQVTIATGGGGGGGSAIDELQVAFISQVFGQ